MTDNVHLRNIRLPLALSVGPDAWHRSDKPQPAVISVRIAYPSSLIASAANQDTVAQTLDYGKLYRTIEEAVRDTSASQIQSLAALIARTGLGLVIENIQTGAAEKPGYESTSFDWQRARDAEIWIRLPKSILRADQGLTYRALFRGPLHEPEQCVEHEFTIEGILCYCILGVNPHERREKQAVQVTLMYRFDEKEGVQSMDLLRSYQDVTRQVAEVRLFLDISVPSSVPPL